MKEDQELRIKCIELAQRSRIDNTGTKITEVAQNFYWFITAKDKEEK